MSHLGSLTPSIKFRATIHAVSSHKRYGVRVGSKEANNLINAHVGSCGKSQWQIIAAVLCHKTREIS